jgi:AcrR family transcriptional regulator
MTDGPSRLMDRKRRFATSDISDVAMPMFAERGFNVVTVEEIAAAAGISARTFFRYFASKEDVVLQYRRGLQERLISALAARPDEEGAVTALRNAYLETTATPVTLRKRVAFLNRVLFETPDLRGRAQDEAVTLDGALVSVLAQRMGLSELNDQVLALAAAMSGVASIVFEQWVRAGGRGDPAARLRFALDFVVDGFAPLDASPISRGSK